jgi:hypothetical protein
MDFQNKAYNKEGSPVSENREGSPSGEYNMPYDPALSGSGKQKLPPLEKGGPIKGKAPSAALDRVPIDGRKNSPNEIMSNEAI